MPLLENLDGNVESEQAVAGAKRGLHAAEVGEEIDESTSYQTVPPCVGLRDGDVVAFLQNGTHIPYVVEPLTLANGDSEIYHMVLAKPGVTAAHPSTHLLVVRQGHFLGFRSVSAGERFLQARRRGPDHVCFFNRNFGTWEQWEFAHGEPKIAWATTSLYLRSRRLPNFVFTVECRRVARESNSLSLSLSALPPLLPPHHAGGGAGGGGLNQSAAREYVSLLQREAGARRVLEEQVSLLQAEVRCVREEADAEVEDLVERLQAAQTGLSALESRVALASAAEEEFRERLGERFLWRWWRSRLQGGLRDWHLWTVQQRRARGLCQRRQQKLLRAVLRGWYTQTAVTECRRTQAEELRKRCQRRHLAAVLRAWREDVVRCQARRQRGLQALTCSRMHRCLAAWRALARTTRDHEGIAAATAERTHLRRAWAAWQEQVAEGQRQRENLKISGQQAWASLMGRVLRAWRARPAEARWERWVVERARRAGTRRLLRGVLCEWQQWARGRREEQQAQEARRVGAAFSRWRATASSSAAVTAATVGWYKDRCLRQQLRAWAAVAQMRCARNRTLSLAVQRRQQRSARGVLQAWRAAVLERQCCERRVERHLQGRAERVLASCFRSWRELRVSADSTLLRAERQLQRGCLARALHGWREEARQTRGAEQVVARRHSRRVAARAFAAWRAYAHGADGQQAPQRGSAALMLEAWAGWRRARWQSAGVWAEQKLQERSLEAWRHATQTRAALRRTERTVAQQHAACLVVRAFSHWRDRTEDRRRANAAVKRVRQRAHSRTLAAAWSGWRERVALGRRVALLASRWQARRLGCMLDAWREVASAAHKQRTSDQLALQHTRSQLLAKSWRAWRALAGLRRPRLLALSAMASSRQKQCLDRALFSWAHVTRLSRERRLAAQRLHERHQRRTLAAALHGWQQCVHAAAHKRRVLADASRALAHSLCGRVFGAWRAAAAESTRVREDLRACLTRQKMAKSMFAQWYWDAFDAEVQQAFSSSFTAPELPPPNQPLALGPPRESLGHGSCLCGLCPLGQRPLCESGHSGGYRPSVALPQLPWSEGSTPHLVHSPSSNGSASNNSGKANGC